MRFNFKEFRNILKSLTRLIDSASFSRLSKEFLEGKRGEISSRNSVACSSPDVTEYPSGGVLVYLKRIPSRRQVTRASFVLINAGDGCLFNVDF